MTRKKEQVQQKIREVIKVIMYVSCCNSSNTCTCVLRDVNWYNEGEKIKKKINEGKKEPWSEKKEQTKETFSGVVTGFN